MIWPIAVVALTIAAPRAPLAPAPLGPAAGADSVDACALFTRDEVEALSQDETTKPRENSYTFNAVTSSSCWHQTMKNGWSVKIIVERGRTPAEMKQLITTLKKVVNQTTAQAAQPVPGIGDEAYWGQISPTNGSLSIVVGTDFITVQTWGRAPGAGTLAKTKEIATVVVDRFKQQYASAK